MKKTIAIIVAVLAAGSIGIAFAWKGRGTDSLVASGTLEARNISVGSKVGGRISRVLVHEGDRVEQNQVLVIFESVELEGQLLQAKGRVEAARANLQKMLRGSRPEEIAEARAASDGFREAELAQARADLERSRSRIARMPNASSNGMKSWPGQARSRNRRWITPAIETEPSKRG